MQESDAPSTACVRLNPFHRGAAGAGITLVAFRITDVAEISATGSLQNIAAEGCHVAQLWTGGKLEQVGDDRIMPLHVRMGGDIGHARQRAELEVAPFEIDLRPRAGQRINVDQC